MMLWTAKGQFWPHQSDELNATWEEMKAAPFAGMPPDIFQLDLETRLLHQFQTEEKKGFSKFIREGGVHPVLHVNRVPLQFDAEHWRGQEVFCQPGGARFEPLGLQPENIGSTEGLVKIIKEMCNGIKVNEGPVVVASVENIVVRFLRVSSESSASL